MLLFWKTKWKIMTAVLTLVVVGVLIFFMVKMYYLMNPFPGSVRVDTILIEKDEDFLEYDFPGTGNPQDPFRLENLQLGTYKNLLKGLYKLIEIRNTNVHIVIQNCIFIGSQNGIFIIDVNEGSITIKNNTFIGKEFQVGDMVFSGSNSLSVINSTNIVITENRFEGEIQPAINVEISSDVIVSNNEILLRYESSAIRFYNASDFILDSNIITPESDSSITDNEGLHFSYSENFTVVNNIIREAGSEFHDCNDLEFQNNTLEFKIGKIEMLLFYSTENVKISDNIFLGTDHYGIIVSSMLNLIITNNKFEAGSRGIYLYDAKYTLISYNSFYSISEYAIWVYEDSSNVTVYHNNFFNNNPQGYSQCYNEDTDSIWYNIVIGEGNYWSNLEGNSTYTIAGPADSVDLYPLADPIET